VTPAAASPLQTTQEHAVAWLRAAIVDGELRPGGRVTQEDVAARIGVSVGSVREALRVLEQEGQLTYRPRRGYFVTELRMADLREIYALRELLEGRAARQALPALDAVAVGRLEQAAAACARAAEAGDVAAELAANRAFHFGILEAPDGPHAMRVIRMLWDSTEAYRALYYNAPEERRAAAAAHERILDAIRAGDPDRLVAELDAHRERALEFLAGVLEPAAG
jgi:DNA-binding GntR family transcriptional regulator